MMKRLGAAAFFAAIARVRTNPTSSRSASYRGASGEHVGECFTVCGVVASAKYADASAGSPTFLNLDRSFPEHVVTVVVWGSERFKFGTPEVDYSGKRICATGLRLGSTMTGGNRRNQTTTLEARRAVARGLFL
jgi:hypothetical protein